MYSLHRLSMFFIFLVFLACTASQDLAVERPKSDTKNKTSIDRLVDLSRSFKHLPYKYGGDSPRKGFDCSGLTQYLYKDIDIILPHSAKMQAKKGRKIKLKDAKVGDLVFFKNKKKISHVAMIYKLEKDEIIIVHSTSSRGVVIEVLNKSTYWMDRFSFIKRIL